MCGDFHHKFKMAWDCVIFMMIPILITQCLYFELVPQCYHSGNFLQTSVMESASLWFGAQIDNWQMLIFSFFAGTCISFSLRDEPFAEPRPYFIWFNIFIFLLKKYMQLLWPLLHFVLKNWVNWSSKLEFIKKHMINKTFKFPITNKAIVSGFLWFKAAWQYIIS